MFASRKSAASTLVSLIIATLAVLGIASGTASADDTHWNTPATTTQGPGNCPEDTHWSTDLLVCVEDTHW
jgi:hypothetical protein